MAKERIFNLFHHFSKTLLVILHNATPTGQQKINKTRRRKNEVTPLT